MPATTDPAVARAWLTNHSAAGIEGVVAKRLDQPYRAGGRTWRKIRTRRTAEAVVGVVLGSIARPEALILGRYDARGRLRVAGPSGSPASCAPARRRPPSSASCALPQWFAARESSS
ncbi:MAG: dependent ligase [Pseudonocardia sp.]|jgi:ATP-dependent DNA ligase|nr:dependent ligase [Pseudonocardia sp.]MDX6361844.1 hypothetical protein [Streptomyces sp.]